MESKRNRRSVKDMKDIAAPYKNVFLSWAYAGHKETVQELFPEETIHWKYIEKEIGLDYFDEIPEAFFRDESYIKAYGNNLHYFRKARKWTLKEAAEKIGIDFQALQQIELGKRSKIHQNLLLIFCALYQTSPERLMGLKETSVESPMTFYPEISSQKAGYVVKRLIHQDLDLLDAFQHFAGMPRSVRQKLTAFLSNAPIIKVLSPAQIEKLVKQPFNSVIPKDENGNLLANRNWSLYYGDICDMANDTPKLLDVYVSIAAADKNIWEITLWLISSAGFFPFLSREEWETSPR